MKKDHESKLYIGIGVFQLLVWAFVAFAAFMIGEFPPTHSYLMIAIAIMAFSMSYLHPQFKQKDERMRLIREKGMFYSYFALMLYYSILLVLLQFEFITLTALEVVYILSALTIATVFLTMVFVAKRH